MKSFSLAKCKLKGLLFFFLIFFALISCGILSSEEQREPSNFLRTNSEISPDLSFSTYFGGTEGNSAFGIATASDGSFYVVGTTSSIDFPTKNAYDCTYNYGDWDAFISKFSANGSLIWSTFLGGNQTDIGFKIAVSNDGSCYITGWTSSSNFPTLNAFNNTYSGGHVSGGGDAFIAKFAFNGSLLWSTYLGGNKDERDCHIAVTPEGVCYVTGYTDSINFPTLNAYNNTNNGLSDAFITKFSSNGELQWSTFYGKNNWDFAHGIAVTNDESCYVTGGSWLGVWPPPNNDTSYMEAFVSKFNVNGSLLWNTYLGGSTYDVGEGIAVTDDGRCYIIGNTWSSDFPTLNAYNDTFGGVSNAFVTALNASGSIIWSTYLGGSGSYGDEGKAIAISSDSSCYVTGYTYSTNFPVKNAIDNTNNGWKDSFISKFSSSGSLLYSTYFGGTDDDESFQIAVENNETIYIVGETWSANFPTLNAYDNTFHCCGFKAFITKITEKILPPTTHPIDTTIQLSISTITIFIISVILINFLLRKRRK